MPFLRDMIGKVNEVKASVKNSSEKCKMTAVGLKRILDLGERLYPKRNWPNTKLYASAIGYTNVPEFVLQYFDHTALVKEFPSTVVMAMETGTALHSFIQSRLMAAGCIHPKCEGVQYQEPRFEDETYRIVAKVDGLICEDQLAELGAKNFEGNVEPRPLKLDLLEIKVFNSFKYKNTKEWTDISREYRLQATATQKISGYDRTIFMIVDRDSMNYRFIVYRAEEHLWEFIKKLSTDIFTHLRELTRPEGFQDEWLRVNGVQLDWDQWVAHHINASPKRKWLHLGDTKEEDAGDGGGFLLI